MQTCADSLKVLADPARLRILKELKGIRGDNGNAGISVCELARRLSLSQPNLSHHLKILKTAGFISCEKRNGRDQRFAYYCVDSGKIESLFETLKGELA